MIHIFLSWSAKVNWDNLDQRFLYLFVSCESWFYVIACLCEISFLYVAFWLKSSLWWQQMRFGVSWKFFSPPSTQGKISKKRKRYQRNKCKFECHCVHLVRNHNSLLEWTKIVLVFLCKFWISKFYWNFWSAALSSGDQKLLFVDIRNRLLCQGMVVNCFCCDWMMSDHEAL